MDASNLGAVSKLRIDRGDYRRRMAAHWKAEDVDVAHMPDCVASASAHDTAAYKSHTSVWNVVDYPSITIPTPLLAKGKGQETYVDQDFVGQEDQCVRQAYEEMCFEGAPLALQLVARKYHGNLLFGVCRCGAN